MLQNPEIKKLILKLWNIFWSGGISNPLTAIEQITYLIFIKRLDVLDKEKKNSIIFKGTYQKTGKEEDKLIEAPKEELRWSNILKIKDKEERLEFISKYVFPEIKKLEDENSFFTKHMQNAVFIIPSASLLYDVMEIIDDIFKEIENDHKKTRQTHQDIQGDVYEMLLNEIASAGKNGQFRTPRHIINLVVELVAPKFGNKVVDPACGSAGFLLGAQQYIVTSLNDKKDELEPDEFGFKRVGSSAHLSENDKNILSNSLIGYDIDQTMVRLGLMNLMMHGIDNPKVDYVDTLSRSFQKHKSELNTYDVVLANPPFTGNLNKGEKDEELRLDTTKTELLFIDRIHSMLKLEGTAGIIIPQGVLFGSANAFVEARKLMIEKSQLKAVISMPSGVFKPYAGVATAILIFTKIFDAKDKHNIEDDYDVFFYDMKSDARSLDDKRVKLEGYGDLQDIISKYKDRDSLKEQNDKKEKYFSVSKKEIKKNAYDLSFRSYQEITYEEEKYDEPKNILDELMTLEDEIQSELKDLKSLF